jgi:hypothetical protein
MARTKSGHESPLAHPVKIIFEFLDELDCHVLFFGMVNYKARCLLGESTLA